MMIFFGVLGAIFASFAGVIAERMYTGWGWFSGRSSCNACGTELRIPDLVPVFSWLASLGRCRYCTARFSGRYALAEVVLAVLFARAYVLFGISTSLLFLLVAVFFLVIIVLYDLRHTIIPHGLSVLFALSALGFFIVTPMTAGDRGLTLFSAAIYGLLFLGLHVLSRGRAMGLADAPLVMSLTLLAGVQAFSGLLLSFWIGALVGIVILVRAPKGRRMGIEVPFAPFLAAGFLLAIFTSWDPLSLIELLAAHLLPL